MIFDTLFRTKVAVYQPGLERVTLSATADVTFLRNVSGVAAPTQ